MYRYKNPPQLGAAAVPTHSLGLGMFALGAGGGGTTPAMLAASIYLDVLNSFLALLQIFGDRRRN